MAASVGSVFLNGGDIHLTPEILLFLLGAGALYAVAYSFYGHLRKKASRT